jgi:hypothetical protein
MTVTMAHERKVAEEVRSRNVRRIKAAYDHGTRGGYDKVTVSSLTNVLRDLADAYNYLPQRRSCEPQHRDPDPENTYADQVTVAKALYEVAAVVKREHGVHHARKAIVKKSHPWAEPMLRHHAYAWNVYLMLLALGDGSLNRASYLVAANFGISGTTLNDAARNMSNAYLDCFKENPKWLAEIRMPRTLGEACADHPDPMEEWLLNGGLETVPQEDVVNPLTTEEFAILMPHLRSGDIIPWLRGRGGTIREKWLTDDDAKALERDPTNWLIPGAPAVPWRLLPGLTRK